MTIEKIIEIVDELMPNSFSDERKIGWLSTLDGKIFNEVLATHKGCPDEFTPYTSTEDELIIDFPYGEEIYTYHLESMIALQNFETAKYNQFATMFEAKYKEWTNWYHRTHEPGFASRVWW